MVITDDGTTSWHIKITPDNIDILKKWYKGTSNVENYNICGFYKKNDRIILGVTAVEVDESSVDWGHEITIEEFKAYILKEKLNIEEDYSNLIRLLKELI